VVVVVVAADLEEAAEAGRVVVVDLGAAVALGREEALLVVVAVLALGVVQSVVGVPAPVVRPAVVEHGPAEVPLVVVRVAARDRILAVPPALEEEQRDQARELCQTLASETDHRSEPDRMSAPAIDQTSGATAHRPGTFLQTAQEPE